MLCPKSNLTSASGSVQVTTGQNVAHRLTTILLLQKQSKYINAKVDKNVKQSLLLKKKHGSGIRARVNTVPWLRTQELCDVGKLLKPLRAPFYVCKTGRPIPSPERLL